MSSEYPSFPVCTSLTVMTSRPADASDRAISPVTAVFPMPVSIPDTK